MLRALDHVVIGVRRLDDATQTLAALLGRGPCWRGEHPGAGTANALFQLENTCIELLAPAGEGADGAALAARLVAAGDGPIGLAFATDDAAAAREDLARRGLHPAALAAGNAAERDSGAQRRWRHVRLPIDATRGVLMFAIERDPASACLAAVPPGGKPAAAVRALDHAVIRTGDPEGAKQLYGEGLGLRLALDRRFDEWGVRLLFFRVGGLTLELAARLGDAADEPLTGDRLWGLSYRVDDVAAARERVAAAGFDVSELRTGRRPGTRVCTVRGEPLGVATLLIGPDQES